MDTTDESYRQFLTKRTDVRQFVAILIGVWILLALVLFTYDSFSPPLYYVLMYLAFLLLLELGSAYLRQLRNKRWLHVLIGVGFVGWIVALFTLFSY